MKKAIFILTAVFLVATAFTIKKQTGFVITDFSATVSGNTVTINAALDVTGENEVIKHREVIQRGVKRNKSGKVIQASPWYMTCDNSALQICGTRWVEDTPSEWTWSVTHSNLATGTYEYKITGTYGERWNNLSSISFWSESVFVTIN